ncbi:sensor histidine kinase [Microvirga massiliensis]|uniref:sensor histidine kinase n=1 Tax=Microvirga massiliensis TaxID=1033741 RepID=UPI0006610593|nr:sensor histidine kinase [Microvirga massiliensis]
MASDRPHLTVTGSDFRRFPAARELDKIAGGRPLLPILEALPAAVYTTDAAGRITFYNQAAVDLWGCRPEIGKSEWCGSWRLYWPDGRPMPHDECPMAIALKEDRAIHDGEAIAERPDGTRVPFLASPTPLHDASGAVIGAVNMLVDVTQRKRSEEHQKVLLAELQHRVRNTLAVIRSIAHQTAETSETVADYAMHLEGRLDAFARVQAVVTRDPAAGVDLASLVAEEMLSCAAKEGEQFSLSGPDVRLRPKAAEILGLAIHELATNAVKYGALSSPNGHVTVAWRLEDQERDPRLRFEWTETGVPVLALAPRHNGFGTELLTQTLPYQLRGTTTLTFKPGGLQCIVELPSKGVAQ